MSSSRRHGPRPPIRHSSAVIAPIPPTLPLQPSRPIRNPWVAASESSASSSASPPRPTASSVRESSSRRPASSLASSSRTPSRAPLPTAAPGCCSPGTQLLCYYCLRAALLVTLLGGGALAVAGVVLRDYGREDLSVLLYIGLLSVLVSATLLAVQNRARHATRRHFQRRVPSTRPVAEAIPLQQFNTPAVPVVPASWPQHVTIRCDELNEQHRTTIQPMTYVEESNSTVQWWRIFGRTENPLPQQTTH